MLISPLITFAGLWVFVIFLAADLYRDAELAYQTSVSAICAFIIGYIITQIREFKLTKGILFTPSSIRESVGFKKSSSMFDSHQVSTIFFAIYILCIILETICAGGMPTLGIMGIGRRVDYTEFGIPGFHGFVNSLAYISVLQTCSLWSKSNINRSSVIIRAVVLAFILILQMQRSVAMISIMLLIFYSMAQSGRKQMFRYLVYLLICILLFGYLGDLRSGHDAFLSLVSPNLHYLRVLPSGFAWTYIYITTPFRNTLYSASTYIDAASNNTFLVPINTFNSLIPSIIRPDLNLNLPLEDTAWNVHSLFTQFFLDFGIYTPIFVFLFGIYCGLTFNYISKRCMPALYALLSVQCIFSIFGEISFHISLIFAFGCCFFLYSKSYCVKSYD
jgi:oligosaccharide repeat unit polymerase